MTDLTEIDEKYACSDTLGMACTSEKTDFSVWSPMADAVTLNIYRSCKSRRVQIRLPMQKSEFGVWRQSVNGDLDGRYYTYTFHFGSTEREAPDIYSRSAGANGRRSMIFSETSVMIDGWENDRPVKLRSAADAVIYELHIRDFSMDQNADFSARGKLIAICEEGVKNSLGDSAGIGHLKQLGITHVHLLPLMQNASVNDLKPQFNWGYDPFLYNVPEGSYCTDPSDGASRIRELRTLVKTLHSNGIGVILDVVYNHTYTVENSPFTAAFPHYYYRHDDKGYSNGSGCGNELATERRMVSRFIRDSLCALARDYHIDGFRFDLMGLMDINTLNDCAKALRDINPEILLYGEGWTGGISPLPEELRAMKHHADRTDGVAMFSDDFRDGVKGSVFSDTERGYINGLFTDERRELIKSVLCGGVYHPDIDRPEWQCWAKSPLYSVNYIEAHDNLTLNDKLVCSMPEADDVQRERVGRLGAALVMLSQGIPFMQAGQELLRSKPDSKGGFVHDSYNSPDEINCIKWDNVTNHRDTVEYFKGLIELRKAYNEFRMDTAEQVRQIRFENLSGAAFSAYIGELILCVNPHPHAVEIVLPQGEYGILANDKRADSKPFAQVRQSASVSPQSILVLCRSQN